MKTNIIVVLLFCLSTFGLSQESLGENTLCKKVTLLSTKIKNSSSPDKVLYEIGKLAQKLEPTVEEYKKNSDLKDICHLKVVKSENFGDFVSYDGYHYQQLILNHPQSNLADDASYQLIYVISEDVYNFADMKVEKERLEAFVKKYPKSNLHKEAKERIKSIERDLKSGISAIMD